jgi:hypothetical protein
MARENSGLHVGSLWRIGERTGHCFQKGLSYVKLKEPLN